MRSILPASYLLSRALLLSTCLLVLGASDGSATDQTAKSSAEHEAPKIDPGILVNRELSAAWEVSTKSYNLASSRGAKFCGQVDSELKVEHGDYLVEALKAVRITTPLAEYNLKPKALIYLQVDHGAERILALLEGAEVVTAKRATDLRFGEEALVSEHPPSHAHLVGREQIGIRQIRTHELASDRNLTIAEFSLVHATERIPLISNTIHSGHSHDKGLKSRLLKAAAVLDMVTSRHGYYSGSR